jgi:uncharacterized protein YjbI with pentapeptide repeats
VFWVVADDAHLKIIRQGVEAWNQWREDNPETRPDLRRADLTDENLAGANLTWASLSKTNLADAYLVDSDLTAADLTRANLAEANLTRTNLTEAKLIAAYLPEVDLSEAKLIRANAARATLTSAYLYGANLNGATLVEAELAEANLTKAQLTGADLSGATLTRAELAEADLSGATLTGTNLYGANLSEANLTAAYLPDAQLRMANLDGAMLTRANLDGTNLRMTNLSRADLTEAYLGGATLVGSTIEQATLSGATVYGAAVWNVRGTPAQQHDLVITNYDEPVVTVDDLKVAQFIHLLLSYPNIRDIVDTITSKVVLILGRFTDERKEVLDRLRDALRDHNFSPVLVDFEVPADRDLTETVTLLARMARFVIADLTDARSIPQELQAFVPDVAVPVQPIILAGQDPWAMFPDLRKYPWMLEPYAYDNLEGLLDNLTNRVINPADRKRTELAADGHRM